MENSKLTGQYIANSYDKAQALVSVADTKANIVLVLIATMLTLFFNFSFSRNPIAPMYLPFILIPFILAGLFAFLTLFPRKGNSSSESLIYFQSAKDLDINSLSLKLEKGYDKEIIKDYLSSTKALGIILDKKFKNLRYAYIFLGLGILVKLFVEWYLLL